MSVDQNVEKMALSYIVGKNVKWYSTLENSLTVPQRVNYNHMT